MVPSVRTNLGYFQLRRYERTGDSTDLANALELLQKAVETLPEDDARCVTARARLAEALVMRHEQTMRQSAAHGSKTPVTRNIGVPADEELNGPFPFRPARHAPSSGHSPSAPFRTGTSSNTPWLRRPEKPER